MEEVKCYMDALSIVELNRQLRKKEDDGEKLKRHVEKLWAYHHTVKRLKPPIKTIEKEEKKWLGIPVRPKKIRHYKCPECNACVSFQCIRDYDTDFKYFKCECGWEFSQCCCLSRKERWA